MSEAHAAERSRSVLARVAAAGALLTLVVIVSSAYLRFERIGLGCDAWPSCYGTRAQGARAAASPDRVVQAMRIAHRLAASGVAILSLAALVFAVRARTAQHAPVAASGALVGLAFLLAVLGRATGSSIAPAVALGNVLGGMAMLALFSGVMFHARRPAAATSVPDVAVRPLAVITLILLAAQIALGVMTSAQLAGRACPDLMTCAALASRSAGDFAVLNPWHAPPPDDTAGRALLQLAHRAGAALTAFALLVLAGISWRAHRGNGAAALGLCALVAAEIALGAGLVSYDLPLAGAVAHNAVAGLIVVAAVKAALYSTTAETASEEIQAVT